MLKKSSNKDIQGTSNSRKFLKISQKFSHLSPYQKSVLLFDDPDVRR